MKRILLIAIVLLSSSILFAAGEQEASSESSSPSAPSSPSGPSESVEKGEFLLLLKYTSLHTTQTYEDYSMGEIKKTISAPGIDFTMFSGFSPDKGSGLYLSAAFVFPNEYNYFLDEVQDYSYSIDNNGGDFPYGIDLVFGYGHLFTVIPSFVILAGGGLHMGGVFMDDSYLLLGPGLEVNAILYLTKSLNLNIGGMAAYDFDVVAYGDTTSSGFTWGLSAGLGLGF